MEEGVAILTIIEPRRGIVCVLIDCVAIDKPGLFTFELKNTEK